MTEFSVISKRKSKHKLFYFWNYFSKESDPTHSYSEIEKWISRKNWFKIQIQGRRMSDPPFFDNIFERQMALVSVTLKYLCFSRAKNVRKLTHAVDSRQFHMLKKAPFMMLARFDISAISWEISPWCSVICRFPLKNLIYSMATILVIGGLIKWLHVWLHPFWFLGRQIIVWHFQYIWWGNQICRNGCFIGTLLLR